MTERSHYEVKDQPVTPHAFTRFTSPTFDIVILRELAQQISLRREFTSVFNGTNGEALLARLCGHIAVVVGMTYAECGDGAKLKDDEALMLIRELLLEVDESVIERSKDRKLPRRFRRLLSCL